MKLLEEKIRKEGYVLGKDILKVDAFLNHQVDVEFMEKIGEEFHRLFKEEGITRILTIEASGIAVACMASRYFKLPVVYAKKYPSYVPDNDVYQSEVYSFTKKTSYNIRVSKKYIKENDRVLIIDDFLANGKAAAGLVDVVRQAGATVAGVGIVIEKGFQPGRKTIEDMGIRVESLAIVESMETGNIIFK